MEKVVDIELGSKVRSLELPEAYVNPVSTRSTKKVTVPESAGFLKPKMTILSA